MLILVLFFCRSGVVVVIGLCFVGSVDVVIGVSGNGCSIC